MDFEIESKRFEFDSVDGMVHALSKEELLEWGHIYDLTLSSRATVSFLRNKVKHHILDNPYSWLSLIPYQEVILLSMAIKEDAFSFESSIPVPYSTFTPCLVRTNIVNYDIADGVACIWLSADLAQAITPVLDDLIEETKNSPFTVIENYFWGSLANYGIIEREQMFEFLHIIFKSDLKQVEQYLEKLNRYAPFRYLLDEFGDVVNPSLTEEDLEFRDSIINKELEVYPDISFSKIIYDGAFYPSAFATPMYFTMGEKGEREPDQYTALFKNPMDQKFLEDLLAPTIQDIDVEDPEAISAIVALFPIDQFKDYFKPEVSEQQIKLYLTDTLANMPMMLYFGYTYDYLKDIKLEFDDESDFEDEFIDDLPKKPSFVNIQRNDPCPCGSGLKYKNCHGKYLS